ncbi:hypothetical protein RUE5091_02596 [Ruegeria denitrificans]|uniref:Uncharacterized protein n=1 Tax=Ruegeria denitrificans TaxID=1715692 RepID=A0A0P1IC35_9RHOB|nr:hypothetical protein RUE5091_02596 [Ruegeria denitrificans]
MECGNWVDDFSYVRSLFAVLFVVTGLPVALTEDEQRQRLDVKELGYYSIRVGTLDNPADFPPELHFGVESQIPWVDTHDDLPRIRTENDPQLTSRWVAVGEPKAGPTPPVAKQRKEYEGQSKTAK